MTQVEEKGKLFVGGLSWETTQASLLAYFSKFGEVQDCVVITNPTTGKSRGFGFITFKDPACVETVQAAGPHILDGKQIDPNGCNRKKVPKGAKGAENSRKKLFVGGLPANIDEAQLREGFGSYGKISEVVIVYDQQKQKPRGFGFLTFESEESVDKIVKERFVLLNGKQVECKRAEAREAHGPTQLVNQIDPSQGLMMIAQGPDGVLGLVPAGHAHPGIVYNTAGGGLVTPTELANAYRGLIPAGGPSGGDVGMAGLQATAGLPAGLKYIAQSATGQQYIMLGGPSGSPAAGALAGGGGYIVQGGPGGGGGGFLVHGGGANAAASGLGGLMMAGSPSGQAGSMLVAAPGGGSYIVHCNTPMSAVANGNQGGYILTGGGANIGGAGGGILVQGGSGGQQYLMQYPGGGASIVQASNQAIDFTGGMGLQQAIHSLSKNEAQLNESDKSSGLVATPSYSVINPYTGAAIGIVGGPASNAVNESNQSLDESTHGRISSSTQEPQTSSSTSAQTTPKVGYYIVPGGGMVAGGAGGIGLSGYAASQYGSPIFASTDLSGQPTIIATPSLTPYGRIASSHATIAQGYHPYRR